MMVVVKNHAGYEVLINLDNVLYVVGLDSNTCKVVFATKETIDVKEPLSRFKGLAKPLT